MSAAKSKGKQGRDGGITLEPYQVILRPLVTEKGTMLSEVENSYTFEVNLNATKIDVREAVEKLFDVKVLAVRTQTRKGKVRRNRFGIGKTRSWKKAIVVLHEDDRISFF